MNYSPIYPQYVDLAVKLFLRLKPGERFCIQQNCMDQAALDYVLSGKVGSGYNYGYIPPRINFDYWEIFQLKTSLENDPQNRRTYVDPDRRSYYDYNLTTGIYTPKTQASHHPTSRTPRTADSNPNPMHLCPLPNQKTHQPIRTSLDTN